MSSLMLLFTQCKAKDPDPELPVPAETVPVQGTFRMTYDDYRILKYRTVLKFDLGTPIPKDYQGLTRTVRVTTAGDQLSIKGMFPEYPDATVKGVIKGDTIYFEPTQLLEGTGGKLVYVHTGFAEYEWPHDKETVSLQIYFKPTARKFHILVPEEDEKSSSKMWKGGCFWLSNVWNGFDAYYSVWRNGRVSGTGFPEAPNHFVNVSFEKISD